MTPDPLQDARRTFVVGHCLGRGGFGEVYRAVMKQPGGMDIDVALKLLRRDISASDQALLRLRDEARLLSALHHPAILRIHDLTTLAGRVCLVTEFVDGQDLTVCLTGTKPMGLRPLLGVLGTVAGALDAAYSRLGPSGGPLRIVHRDVKPSNIRIGFGGEVKLLDFGIARTDELTREARTGTDMMVGSPPYMGPERFLRGDPDPASDVFALGAILFEGLAGQRLFSMPVTVQAAHAVDPNRYRVHLSDSLRRIAHQAPEATELIAQMVDFDPTQRPTAAETSQLCDALADLLDGPTLDSWTRRRSWPTAVLDLPGDLDGRSLVEGAAEVASLETDLRPVAATMDAALPLAEPRRRAGWVLSGFAATMAVGVVLVVVSVVGLNRLRPEEGAPPAAAIAAQPEPQGLEAAEDVAAEGVAEEHDTRVNPQPPHVADPVPPAKPQTVEIAAPRPTGTVHARAGSVSFILQGNGGTTLAMKPGESRRVPPGDWVVFANWAPDRVAEAGDLDLTVTADSVHYVNCNKQMGKCSARPDTP